MIADERILIMQGECISDQVPESSKALKFEPLNHQKQTSGLKFDILGGPRYI